MERIYAINNNNNNIVDWLVFSVLFIPDCKKMLIFSCNVSALNFNCKTQTSYYKLIVRNRTTLMIIKINVV
jgi:hypothetical protein